MKKIGILTYNRPHKKTQDIVFRLLSNNYFDITLIPTDFEERKPHKPLYYHREYKCINLYPEEMAAIFGCKVSGDMYGFDKILIGGCNILEVDDIEKYNIVNAHPGILPYSRGLDAFKWAIYNKHPLGVTTHIINNEVDSGRLIDQKFIPVYWEDSFHSVAQRLYNLEIDMLIDSIEKDVGDYIDNKHYEPTKRMPMYIEQIMIERFESLRKNSKSKYE